MATVTHIIPRSFGKVVDLRKKFPQHKAVANVKRGVVLMIPRKAANGDFPEAA